MTSSCLSPAEEVRRWVERLVVAEGLCPFAAKPMREQRVRVFCSEALDAGGVYRDFLAEVEQLLAVDESVVETSLMVVPRALADFDDYLDMLAELESALQELELEDLLQVASFHPDYRFAGEGKNSPTHYTNRSPYPVFHLIRQASITRARESGSGVEEIPQRNQQRMCELGIDYLKRLSGGFRDPD